MMQSNWAPISLSRSMAPGTSAGTVLMGQEVVVWRDVAGAAHVWEDRCPHRGMKLSFGFVRGDHIACLYHGWQYDAQGLCRHIPAHPDLAVPSTICARTFAVAETGGMIWASLAADPGPPPDVPAATPLRSLYVDCPADRVRAMLGAPSPLGAVGPPADAGAVVGLPTDLGLLVIGVQPVDAARAALHLTVQDAASGAALLTLCARTEAFRRMVEAVAVAA